MVSIQQLSLLTVSSFLVLSLHISSVSSLNLNNLQLSSDSQLHFKREDNSIPEGVSIALSQVGSPSRSISEVERTSQSGQAGEAKTGEGGRWGKSKSFDQESASPTSISISTSTSTPQASKNRKENQDEMEIYWTYGGGAFGCLDGASAKGNLGLCSASTEVFKSNAMGPEASTSASTTTSSVKPTTAESSSSTGNNPESSASSNSTSSAASSSESSTSTSSTAVSSKFPSSSSSSLSPNSSSSSSASAARRASLVHPTDLPEARGAEIADLTDAFGIIGSALSSLSSRIVEQASQMAETKSVSSSTNSTSSDTSSAQSTSSSSGMAGTASSFEGANKSNDSLLHGHKSHSKISLSLNSSPLPTSNRAYASKLARRQDDYSFTGFPTTTLALSPSSTPSYETLSDIAQTLSSAQPNGRGPSGNGDSSPDINNIDSPDLPWLDLIVGGIPYKNGDLAASIVWILATLALIPLFLIRLLRRSSLISMVLITIFFYMILLIATFGIRAYISNTHPTTALMIAENAMLSISIPLLTEPLLHLLGLYASQGTKGSGVPTAAGILRFLNFVALLLYVVAAAYTGIYLKNWNNVLSSDGLVDPDSLPKVDPVDFVRIGPIVASFFLLIIIIGGLLLLPVARGESKNSKPGGFLALLFVLLAIPVIYRVLQTLHASNELKGDSSDNPFASIFNLGAPPSRAGNNGFVAQLAASSDRDGQVPPGMYSPEEDGIAWSQLQQTLAGRGKPQTPLIFNLVYVLPQYLMVLLFFFVHAPKTEAKKDAA